MKFSDIRTMHNPNYRITVPLDYLEVSLADYITRHNLDLDPDFQRGYVWTLQQQIHYVEFMFKDPPTGREIYLNCPGWMNDFRGPMTIVDGKQRINALVCFLQNKVPIFDGNYHKDFEGRLGMAGPSLFFNINKLDKRKDILQWYIDLNTGGTIHTDDEINKVKTLLDKCA